MKAMIFVLAVFLASHSVFADSSTHVYECKVNGQRVFSDHACGDDAVERDVTVSNRMDAVKLSSSGTKTTTSHSTRKRRDTGTDVQDKRRQQCARIQTSRDALNEKMRTGYTAKQDERLHQRLRKLDDGYFKLRCSGLR